MLLVGISAVIQLVLDVQVVVCNPHVGYIDAVIADAVGLFGRHEIDVFCEDILYMVDLGIVVVSVYLLVQQVEVHESALALYQCIVVYPSGVAGKHFGSFVQCEVIVFSIDDAYGSDGE